MLSLDMSYGVVRVRTALREGGPARFLLLHGNPGSMLDLALLFRPLGELGALVAYDAPGFGRSPEPKAGAAFGLDGLAELAVRMLDHLGWSDAVLVGHSHGGGVAQRVAHRFPDRVRSLALLGTLGTPAHLTYRLFPLPGAATVLSLAGGLIPRLPLPVARAFVRAFMDLNFAPAKATDEAVDLEVALLRDRPWVLRNMQRLTWGRPCDTLGREASRLRARTLFLHGEEDRIVPIRYAEGVYVRMVRAGCPARFVTFERVGHMVAAQAPDRCVREIQAYLLT